MTSAKKSSVGLESIEIDREKGLYFYFMQIKKQKDKNIKIIGWILRMIKLLFTLSQLVSV